MGDTNAKGACSRSRLLTWFLLVQAVFQISAFAFLYSYIAKVESDLRDCRSVDNVTEGDYVPRQKRSSALLEDNAVAEIYKVILMSLIRSGVVSRSETI